MSHGTRNKAKASITEERMAARLRCVDINVDWRARVNNVDRRGRVNNVDRRGRVTNVAWRESVNEQVGEGSRNAWRDEMEGNGPRKYERIAARINVAWWGRVNERMGKGTGMRGGTRRKERDA
jgi:hypothetical protein